VSRTKRLGLLSALLVVSAPWSADAAPGDADPAFSEDGFAISSLGSAGEAHGATSIAVDVTDDGRAVVGVGVGYISSCLPTWGCSYDKRPAVARFNPNGTLDSTFAGDGELEPEAFPQSAGVELRDLEVQQDGKIVLVGVNWNSSAVWAARLNEDGTPDLSFGDEDGAVTHSFVRAGQPISGSNQGDFVAVDAQGRILIAGRSDPDPPNDPQVLLARLMPNGAIDTSFSQDGWLNESTPKDYYSVVGVRAEPGGRIVTAAVPFGGDVDVFAYDENGTRDASFSGDGLAEIDSVAGASDVTGDPLGRTLVLGQRKVLSERRPVLFRLTVDGELDSAFGEGGVVPVDPPVPEGVFAYNASVGELDVDAQSRPLVAGGYGPQVLGRFEHSGKPDQSYSSDGWLPLFRRDGGIVNAHLAVGAGRVYMAGATGWIPDASPVVGVRMQSTGPADADADGHADDQEQCPLIFGNCPRLKRRIILTQRTIRGRSAVRGLLRAKSTFCRESPHLRLLRLSPGRDEVVGTATDTGVIKLPRPFTPGRYQATASERSLGYGVCPRVRSHVLRVESGRR